MSLTTLVNQLNSSAQKYGVPSPILLGVFGKETDFGNNVATSSAGAQGFMQFIPSTAAQYGYPLTNNPSPAQAQAQFDAAAHYIADLTRQHGGNLDAALKAYSGGGYGLSEVQAKAKSALGTQGAAQDFGGVQGGVNIPNPIPDVAGAISTLGSTISGGFNQAIKDAKYGLVLVAAVLVAGFLLIHGLTGKTPADGVRAARKVAA